MLNGNQELEEKKVCGHLAPFCTPFFFVAVLFKNNLCCYFAVKSDH